MPSRADQGVVPARPQPKGTMLTKRILLALLCAAQFATQANATAHPGTLPRGPEASREREVAAMTEILVNSAEESKLRDEYKEINFDGQKFREAFRIRREIQGNPSQLLMGVGGYLTMLASAVAAIGTQYLTLYLVKKADDKETSFTNMFPERFAAMLKKRSAASKEAVNKIFSKFKEANPTFSGNDFQTSHAAFTKHRTSTCDTLKWAQDVKFSGNDVLFITGHSLYTESIDTPLKKALFHIAPVLVLPSLILIAKLLKRVSGAKRTLKIAIKDYLEGDDDASVLGIENAYRKLVSTHSFNKVMNVLLAASTYGSAFISFGMVPQVIEAQKKWEAVYPPTIL